MLCAVVFSSYDNVRAIAVQCANYRDPKASARRTLLVISIAINRYMAMYCCIDVIFVAAPVVRDACTLERAALLVAAQQ